MNKPVEDMSWEDHQAWERTWWGNCVNTFGEEAKQITYAHRMGLVMFKHTEFYETWPLYDMKGKSVVDIGGGPCSMLLKTHNLGHATVIDPCQYPTWTESRYAAAGIEVSHLPGEYSITQAYDEAWIYNVLQHVRDPEKIITNALRCSKVVRIFEWIDRGTGVGHPQALTAARLDAALGLLDATGMTENLQGENACYGMAYYGEFKGFRVS